MRARGVRQVRPAAHRGRRGVDVDGDLLLNPGPLREQPRGGQGGGGDRRRAELADAGRRGEHRVRAAQRHLLAGVACLASPASRRGSGRARVATRADGREHVVEDRACAHPKTLVSSTRWSWLGIGSHSSASILLNVSVYSMRLEKAPDGMCGVLASPAQLS